MVAEADDGGTDGTMESEDADLLDEHHKLSPTALTNNKETDTDSDRIGTPSFHQNQWIQKTSSSYGALDTQPTDELASSSSQTWK